MIVICIPPLCQLRLPEGKESDQEIKFDLNQIDLNLDLI